MRLQAIFVAIASFALTHSSAQSAANRCAELKPLAAKVRVQNEFVQEQTSRNPDPEWCSHARSMTQAMEEMLQIIHADPTRCRNTMDKVEALQKAADRMSQLSEGCP
jgi:hypothetical protein